MSPNSRDGSTGRTQPPGPVMASARTEQGGTKSRADNWRLRWLPVACVYPLMLLTFQAPGRESAGSVDALDPIALMKVGSRGALVAVLAILLLRLWRHSRRPAVMRCFLPLSMFVLWSLVSTLWSPLKAVSLGQSSSLLLLVLLAAVLAVPRSGPLETSAVLFHLSSGLLVANAALLGIHLVAPEASGLGHGALADSVGAGGFIHPTAASATAGVGIVLLVASRLLWDWTWTKILLVPGLLIHAAILYVATRRVALVLTLSLTLLACCTLINRLLLVAIFVAASAGGAIYLIGDPGLELVEKVFHYTDSYVRRGESEDELSSATGRTYLWREVLQSFGESPVYGHGYFVTSKDGLLDVREWYRPATNRTAHNLFLQVLVSTGVVGLLLFLWGMIRPLRAWLRHSPPGDSGRRLRIFLLLVGGWYVGSGLFGESFLGPLLPESVVFFSLLGLALGNLSFETANQSPGASPAAPSFAARVPKTNGSRPLIARGDL